ncbi:hypothetical protein [Streptomyces sp. NPDC001100]
MAQTTHRWRAGASVLAAAGLLVLGLRAPAVSAAGEPRTDLAVLVVDNGDGPVEAVAAQLKSEGVPYTTVNLNDSGRPTIDAAFLGDTVDGTPRARFQGVVLPNEAPFGAGSAEQTALEAYETTYGIPQVDAYTWAHPEVGLDYAAYSGGASVYCAVPGMGDHPWGTLPHTLEPAP